MGECPPMSTFASRIILILCLRVELSLRRFFSAGSFLEMFA
jgi:hypothetical protein